MEHGYKKPAMRDVVRKTGEPSRKFYGYNILCYQGSLNKKKMQLIFVTDFPFRYLMSSIYSPNGS